MQTRDELLNGLNDAVSIIGQLANIQQRLNQVRSQYKNITPNKKMGKLAKLYLVYLVITSFIKIAENGISIIFSQVIVIAVFFGLIKGYYILRNKKIDSDNEKVRTYNENVKAQEQTVLNELQKVQVAYRERVGYWYPDKYCSVDAVGFFYNAIKDYRADNIKEAINLYETTLHQRRVEDNQKKAIEQQKLNNLLAVGSLAMQGAALGEMSRHNATKEYEMQKANRTLNNIRNSF